VLSTPVFITHTSRPCVDSFPQFIFIPGFEGRRIAPGAKPSRKVRTPQGAMPPGKPGYVLPIGITHGAESLKTPGRKVPQKIKTAAVWFEAQASGKGGVRDHRGAQRGTENPSGAVRPNRETEELSARLRGCRKPASVAQTNDSPSAKNFIRISATALPKLSSLFLLPWTSAAGIPSHIDKSRKQFE